MMPSGAFAGTLQLCPFLARKFPNIRSWLVVACQCITTLAAILLAVLPQNKTGALLFALYILPAVGGGYAVLMGLQIPDIASYTKRSIASSGLYIGYCLGNFVGPMVFEEKDKPRCIPGFVVVIVTSAVAGLLVMVYRYVCIWDNRKRDKAGTVEGFENAYQDDFTDKTNLQFRYIL